MREGKNPQENEAEPEIEVSKLPSKDYMDKFVNPKEFLESQRKKLESEKEKRGKRIPEEPERDVLLFLGENAPIERW